MLGLSGTTSSLYLTMSKMYMTASLMDSPLQSSQPRTFNFGLDQSIFFPSHWLTSSTHDYRPLYNEDIFIFISSFVIFFSHELQVIWKIWLNVKHRQIHGLIILSSPVLFLISYCSKCLYCSATYFKVEETEEFYPNPSSPPLSTYN